MDINFDFRSFQNEIANKFSQCISESFEDDDTNMQDVSDSIDEANISYRKIQKILNTPEMEKCHPWLYSLDMENLNEDEALKVDKIYDLGVKRGVIQEDNEEEQDDINECGDDVGDSDQICGGPEDALTNQEMTPQETNVPSSDSSFTVLYSAIKDGKIKTGEYYSNALDNEGAKEDCLSNLTQVGYSAIRVLGIEKTNTAVDTNVDSIRPDVDMYDGLEEDDSEEYEKQETGDADNETDVKNNVKSDEKKNVEDDTEDKSNEIDDKEQESDNEEKMTDDSDKEDKTDDAEQNDSEKTDDAEKDDSEKDDNEEEKEEKLSTEEKKALKDEYTSTFRSILIDMKVDKSVEEMTLSEKNDFYSKLAKKWTKNDPSEFMTDKEQEKLNKTVIKK